MGGAHAKAIPYATNFIYICFCLCLYFVFVFITSACTCVPLVYGDESPVAWILCEKRPCKSVLHERRILSDSISHLRGSCYQNQSASYDECGSYGDMNRSGKWRLAI